MQIAKCEFATYKDLGFTPDSTEEYGRLVGAQRGIKGLEPPVDLNNISLRRFFTQYTSNRLKSGVVELRVIPVTCEAVQPARSGFKEEYFHWLEYFASERSLFPMKVIPGGRDDGDEFLKIDQLLENKYGLPGYLLGSKLVRALVFDTSIFPTPDDLLMAKAGYIFGFRVGWMRERGQFMMIQSVPPVIEVEENPGSHLGNP